MYIFELSNGNIRANLAIVESYGTKRRSSFTAKLPLVLFVL